ncbi:uncharacterized protein [Henckelia pumila]|uniref:uncharacterized protein n=1 Tax=Henckelia pumila TaxID=405737 RepID=UPI003C6DCBBC
MRFSGLDSRYYIPHANRTILDAAAAGNLLTKSPEEGFELIEEMASSSYHPQSKRNILRKSAGMHQVDVFTSVAAQLEVMNKKIDELSFGNSAIRIKEVWCGKCGAEHFTKDYQTGNPHYQLEGVMANHVGNQNRPRNDPFLNTYNPGWKQCPNFSWGGQNNKQYGNQNYGKQPQEEKSSMEQMMKNFISSTETKMHNQDASIKNLENKIEELSKAMASRDPGTLPSDTEKNPKEQVKEIELRSGKKVETDQQEPQKTEVVTSNFVIPPPFPAALKKAKLDVQFAKFLEVFKKLNINIPFTDAVMQMPSYAKFLKEILSNKRKLKEHAKLDFGEPKPTKISLQLADRSIKYPRMIIEDVLVKVDKFIFSVDFVVLDMEEDLNMPLILGRPFLAIGKALIDVQKEELLLRVGEEKISFYVYNALKCSQLDEECFQIDVVDSIVYNYVQETFQDTLEAALASLTMRTKSI